MNKQQDVLSAVVDFLDNKNRTALIEVLESFGFAEQAESLKGNSPIVIYSVWDLNLNDLEKEEDKEDAIICQMFEDKFGSKVEANAFCRALSQVEDKPGCISTYGKTKDEVIFCVMNALKEEN